MKIKKDIGKDTCFINGVGKDTKFIDLRLPVFYNSRNGQMTVCLPKKKIKKKVKYVYVRYS